MSDDIVFHAGDSLHFMRVEGNTDTRLVYRGDLAEVTR